MEISRQFFYFACVGVFGTGAQYLTLIFLVQLMAIHPVVASTAGYAIGALVNYFLNYRFTFRSTKRHVEAMPKFFTVALVGLGLNAAFMAVLVNRLVLHYLWSQILSTCLVLIWNYAANRVWTFGQ